MCDARLSIFLNDITCGPKGVTLCARAYQNKLNGKLRGYAFVWLADKVFGENHCFHSWMKRIYNGSYTILNNANKLHRRIELQYEPHETGG